MNRRAFATGLGAVLAAPRASGAQQTGKVPRLGMIFLGSPPNPLLEAFKQGLRELGYVEGRNVTIEYLNRTGFSGDLVT